MHLFVRSDHHALLDRLGRAHLGGLDTEAVPVPVEENALALALGALGRLDPLAPADAAPQSPEEADRAVLSVGAVVAAHDLLDRLAGLVGMVEGDSRHVVVQHVRLDDTVQKLAADETELTIDGSSGTAHVVPRFGSVVRKRRVGVLQVGDGNCGSRYSQSKGLGWGDARGDGGGRVLRRDYLPSQWFTQR